MRVPQALPKAVRPSLGTCYTSLEDGMRMRNCPFRSQDEVKDSSYWDPRPTKRFEKSYCSLILGQAPRLVAARSSSDLASWRRATSRARCNQVSRKVHIAPFG